MQPKYEFSTLCDKNCGVQRLNRRTDGHTDRIVKTEDLLDLDVTDAGWLRTEIIGGPIIIIYFIIQKRKFFYSNSLLTKFQTHSFKLDNISNTIILTVKTYTLYPLESQYKGYNIWYIFMKVYTHNLVHHICINSNICIQFYYISTM